MLLNEDNIILAVGNPVNNPHVRTLYKDIISGSNSYGNYLDSTSINVTISRAYRQLGLVKAHHTIKEEFYISNNSSDTVTITNIITSCDCISIESPSMEIAPNDDTPLICRFAADSIEGKFSKEIDIFINNSFKPIKLNINGYIIQ